MASASWILRLILRVLGTGLAPMRIHFADFVDHFERFRELFSADGRRFFG